MDGDGGANDVVVGLTTGGFQFISKSASGISYSSIYDSAYDVSEVTMGDFDGDGIDEAVVHLSGLGIYQYELDGTVIGVAGEDIGSTYTNLMSGDFNGDGKDDIVVEYGGWLQWRDSATGLWTGISASDSSAIGVGDLNGDGVDDIATYTLSTGLSVWDPVTGQTQGLTGVWGNGFSALSISDFDGDGDFELIGHHNDLGIINYNQIDGLFSSEWDASLSGISYAVNEMQISDINNDGRADVVGIVDGTLQHMNIAQGGTADGDILRNIENLEGSNFDDRIIGDGGENTLHGGAGNDILGGGAGNDILDGGVGVDTAVFSGNASDYDVAVSGQTITLTDININVAGDDGTDILSNIERFEFADGTLFHDGTNHGPVAVADTSSTSENASISIDVLANDTDSDIFDSLTVTSVTITSGAGGNAWMDPNTNTVMFDPGTSFDYLGVGETATSIISYDVSDENGGVATQTATVTITGTNEDPVAVADTQVTDEDTSVTILAATLLANDTDIDGGVLSLSSVSNPVGGTVATDVNGDVVFTPTLNFSGTATFDYTASDGQGGFNSATVNVDVTAVADALTLTSSLLQPPVSAPSAASLINTYQSGGITYDANEDTGSQITSLEGGGYVVAWTGNHGIDGTLDEWGQLASSEKNVFARIYNADGTAVTGELSFGSVNVVNGADKVVDSEPQVISLVGGGFAITWQEQSAYYDVNGHIIDSNNDIQLQNVAADGTMLGSQVQVSQTLPLYSANYPNDIYANHTHDAHVDSQPQITSLAGGGYVIVWSGMHNSFDANVNVISQEKNIYARIYNADGTALTGEMSFGSVDLKTTPYVEDLIFDLSPRVTALSNGGFALAWHERTDSIDPYAVPNTEVKLQTVAADGTLIGSQVQVTQTQTYQTPSGQLKDAFQKSTAQNSTQITALDGGGYVVTWHGNHGTYDASGNQVSEEQNVYARIYNADGTAVTGELPFGSVNVVSGSDNNYDLSAQTIALSGGGFAIAWSEFKIINDVNGNMQGFYANIQLQTVAADGTLVGSQVLVNQTLSYHEVAYQVIFEPQITSLVGGGYVVAWHGNPISYIANGVPVVAKDNIFARVFNADGTAATDEMLLGGVTDYDVRMDLFPQVTALPDGGFAIAWNRIAQNSDGSSASDVFVQHFNSTQIAPKILTFNERSVVPLDIQADLSDTDGSETLSITVSGMPVGASLSAGTDNGDGSWSLTSADLVGLTLTPSATSQADLALTVTATSTETSNGSVATADLISISLTYSANNGPVANADSVAIYEDYSVTIDVLANDTGIDSFGVKNLDSVVVSNGLGVASISGGQVIWEPGASYNYLAVSETATVTLDYTMSVGSGAVVSSSTVTITVTGTNDGPVAMVDSASTNEDAPVTILAATLLVNDTDVDGDALSLTSVSNPVGGTVAMDMNGDVVFTPDVNFNGQATFDYAVSDGNGGTSTSTVTVDVAAVNDDPVGTVDNAATNEDVPVTILAATLLANDTDVDGDALTLSLVYNPVGGTVARDVNGDVVFTPDANFNGQATFDYAVSDGNGGMSLSTVIVDVVAVADAPTLSAGVMVPLSYTPFTTDGASQISQTLLHQFSPGQIIDTNEDKIPQITSLVGGGYVVTWYGLHGVNGNQATSEWNIFARIFNADGSAVTGELSIGDVNYANGYDQNMDTAAQVTALSDGGFAMAWKNHNNEYDANGTYTGYGTDIQLQTVAADGTLVGSQVQVSQTVPYQVGVRTYDGYGDDTPQITSLVDGGYVVTWTGNHGIYDANGNQISSERNIYARIYNADGTAVTSELSIGGVKVHASNGYDQNVDIFAQVTALSSGGFAMAWQNAEYNYDANGNYTGYRSDIQLQTIAADGSLVGSQVQVSQTVLIPGQTDDGYQDYTPQITSLMDGGYVVTWSGSHGNYDANGNQISSEKNIYARVYNADGTAATGELSFGSINVVNGTDQNNDYNAQVTALSGGGFAMAWQNREIDHDVNGIYTGYSTSIQLQTVAADGTLIGSQIQVSQTKVPYLELVTQITSLVGGGYVVTWGGDPNKSIDASQFLGEINILARVYNADGTAVTGELSLGSVNFVNGADKNYDSNVQVTALSDGGFALAWNDYKRIYDSNGDYTGNSTDIFIQQFNRVQGSPVELSFHEGSEVPLDIQTALSGVDGSGTLSITISGMPVGASLSAGTDNGDGSWTLSPADLPGLSFTASPTSQVDLDLTVAATSTETSNGSVATTLASISLLYRANSGPAANADGVSIDEDSSIIVDVLANDTDVNTYDVRSLDSVVLTNGLGTASISGNQVVWDPGTAYNYLADGVTATVTLDYTMSDGAGAVSTSTVAITVTGTNDGPVAVADSSATNEDAQLTILAATLLANDTDVDGDALSLSSVSNPVGGTVELDVNGDVVFTPTLNFNGSATFDYAVSDGNGGTSLSTVTVDVAAVNDAPTSGTPSFSTAEDTAITVTTAELLAGSSDLDGDALSVSGVALSDAAAGALVDNLDGTWTFTPATDWNGSLSLNYSVGDGTALVAGTAALTVTAVNDGPVANADSAATNEDAPVTILATTLLANDTDVEGDALSLSSVGNPVGGTVVLDGNGDVVFTPDASFNGAATFDYTISDGNGGTSTSTVAVDVVPSVSTLEDTSVTVLATTLPLMINDPLGFLSLSSVSNPVGGTVELDVNGDVVFTPDANFNGLATFDYTVTTHGRTPIFTTSTVTVDVVAVNDAPTSGAPSFSTAEDTAITVTTAELLAGSSDLDGDALSVSGVALSDAASGALVDNLDGTWTFTPATDWNGSLILNYSVSDGTASVAGSAALTVTAVNDGPVAVADSATTDVGTVVTVLAVDLLANDMDPDGDALSLSSVSNGVNGSVVFDGSGNVVFTPSTDFTGLATFDYTVSDGNGSTATQTVTVTVAASSVGGVSDGTAGADTLVGDNGANIINGNGGNDTLWGLDGDDILNGGIGNDTLYGGAGNDVYQMARGDGQDLIVNIGEGTSADSINFTTGVNHDQLWFSQSGNDLVVEIIGTTDQTTVSGWYASTNNQVARIETSDGFFLSNSMVVNLVSAMAGMTPPPAGQTNLTASEQTQLNSVITANWQV